MTIETLWNDRFQQHLQKITMYFARIASGLIYSFLLLLCVGGYYYAKFLRSFPSESVALTIVTVLLTIALTRSPIRTFLQKPDILYLLPIEEKLAYYFKRSLLYSYIIQLFPLLCVVLIITPLAQQSLHTTPAFLCGAFVILAFIKWWNMYLHWTYRGTESISHWLLIRIFCNAAITYTMFQFTSIMIVGSILLFITLLFLYTINKRKRHIHWEYLIEQEEKMDMRFYQFIHFFTDVPQIKQQVKQRKWLTVWIERLLYQKRSPFLYLYSLSFLRANGYLGIYIRLTVVGCIVLYYSPTFIGKGIIALCILYITALQLRALWNYFSGNSIVALYPVSLKERKRAFITLVFLVTIVQLTFFSIMVLLSTGYLLFTLLLLVGSILFIHLIVLKKAKTYISTS
ncbi:ABC transporter permease [Bacillus sp. 3103sda1]|uniref:ABC transporter permease n=1 Tax=unclassified Bacillus (in: firmicutes) TaxID=185979 RepID=UPI0020A1CE83|nr:ABC transporter permease [Bacillus sp. 3103sda1]MCP1122525.1 ABC transporter permease [Bacillus sp. 3103sda1]